MGFTPRAFFCPDHLSSWLARKEAVITAETTRLVDGIEVDVLPVGGDPTARVCVPRARRPSLQADPRLR